MLLTLTVIGRPILRLVIIWALFLSVALLVACSSSGVSVDGEECGRDIDIAGYRLGPGDQVRALFAVYREGGPVMPLAGEIAVDGEGILAVPLVGEIKVDGLTAREVEDQIEGALKAGGYLVDPQVGIEVITPFHMLGAVANPGEYEYESGMTVARAASIAGGLIADRFTYRADQDDIVIERAGCRFAAELTTPVLPGDVITVPGERFF
jgi:protein involved in polysaccharide export with SLBB domain